MTKRITIIQGHPDPRGHRFGNALADAYAEGAHAAGHEVKRIDVAMIDFPLLRSSDDFYQGATPEAILPAQDAIRWADHLVIFYPLWHGHPPAVFHAFLEQTFRPGFAIANPEESGGMPNKLLTGKTARVVVTMGMPALFYRYYFGAHSLKSLARSILGFSGIKPVTKTMIGRVGFGGGESEFPSQLSAAQRQRWLDKLRALGREGR